MRSDCGKSAETAFPRVPAQLYITELILGRIQTLQCCTCPMSEERNCEERHKWIFENFLTLGYKSKNS